MASLERGWDNILTIVDPRTGEVDHQAETYSQIGGLLIVGLLLILKYLFYIPI